MADFYLMRFAGGPLDGKSLTPKRDTYGWPLPRRVGILCHLEQTPMVASWNADDPAESGLPSEITGSPNAVVYVKQRESQLPESADDNAHVARGAEYVLEG